MATRPVRFEFKTDRPLTFTHELPATLVGPGAAALPGYRDGYIAAVAPIMRAHVDECVAASDPTCSVCGRAPTKSVLTTPMSYLHVEPQPMVAVLCNPVCESKRCSDDGTAGINQLMSEMMGGMQPGQVSARASRVSRNASCVSLTTSRVERGERKIFMPSSVTNMFPNSESPAVRAASTKNAAALRLLAMIRRSSLVPCSTQDL